MSTHTHSLGLDYGMVDGLQAAIVTVAGQAWTGILVVRSEITSQDAEKSGGAFTTSDVRILVPEAELHEVDPPVVGSTITVEDSAYTVLLAARDHVREAIDCVCRLLAILDRVITIDRAGAEQGPSGAAVRRWTPGPQDIKAGVAEASAEVIDEQQRIGLRVTHRVFFAAPVDLLAGDRIRDQASGESWLVKSWQGRDRIDAATEVFAEQVR